MYEHCVPQMPSTSNVPVTDVSPRHSRPEFPFISTPSLSHVDTDINVNSMVRGTATPTFPDGVTGHSQGHNWFFRHSTRACDVSYNGIRRNEEA